MSQQTAEAATGVVLTDEAAEKVKALIEKDGEEGLHLRVEVSPGGCSGLRYGLFFDTDRREDDKVFSYDGFDVVVDKMSHPYLIGASIDYADTIQQQGFTIDNPNAQGSCACGDSFH
ncbi:iron-sulfur cluster insertion protein ErpA [Haloglycomyces albus]|uniref:iron-sulfur cluster insertion protein ErpA n=1 Tax=Haloglycomyces albus TaxID=526067 RepID=UPI00046D6E53|nr:iron-sulfur cluster insertion protein ErpA [Haloglycomyces albus]